MLLETENPDILESIRELLKKEWEPNFGETFTTEPEEDVFKKEEMKVNEVDLGKIKLTFDDAIADADVVAESVTFVAEPEKFTVAAEGDLSKAQIERLILRRVWVNQ